MKIEEIPLDNLVLHPVASTTPIMDKIQYEALKQDIEVNGQLDPITVYRMKIVDGRHRHKILGELGEGAVKAVKLPNNTTLDQLKAHVQSKELRRHETASQLAIMAYRLSLEDGYTQVKAAEAVGANKKRVSEAKKIAVTYGRNDILELLHNGKKFNTGTDKVPFWTDSLGTIQRWLAENAELPVEQPKVDYIEELSDDEQALANHYYVVLMKESERVRKEITNLLYISGRDEE